MRRKATGRAIRVPSFRKASLLVLLALLCCEMAVRGTVGVGMDDGIEREIWGMDGNNEGSVSMMTTRWDGWK